MTDIKKLIVPEYHKIVVKNTPEKRYWKKFRFTAAVKEYSSISHLSFSLAEPYHYAVTCGSKVNIYNRKTSQVEQSITRFKKGAYSGHLRKDGKLLVAGDEDHLIQVFEVGTRSILRQMAGHARAVQFTRFDESNTNVMSGSDDKTVRSWDLATGEEVVCYTGHTDYVRCGVTVSSQHNLLISGSYDHTIKLWDKRSKECVGTFEHGHPVESVVALSTGTIIVTAGHNKIKVWDVKRCALLTTIHNHQKTVSSLALDSTNTRLLSGSLDHQVKMYEMLTYKVTHSIKYPAPVLCLGTTVDNTHLVVGCSDGIVHIRERPTPKEVPRKRPLTSIHPGSLAYFTRGKNAAPRKTDVIAENPSKKVKLPKYDLLLKRFQYCEAFDYILKNKQNPELVVTVIRELFRRDTVKQVLSNRDEVTIKPILNFLINNITHPRHCAVLTDLTHIVLDLYSSVIGLSPTIDKLLQKLNNRLEYELKVQEQFFKLQGAIECFFTATQT